MYVFSMCEFLYILLLFLNRFVAKCEIFDNKVYYTFPPFDNIRKKGFYGRGGSISWPPRSPDLTSLDDPTQCYRRYPTKTCNKEETNVCSFRQKQEIL